MILGQPVKDDGQLPVRQHLHMVLGSRAVLGQDLRNGLGGEAEVLRHLMDSVFFNSQMKHLVLFLSRSPFENRRTLRRLSDGLGSGEIL